MDSGSFSVPEEWLDAEVVNRLCAFLQEAQHTRSSAPLDILNGNTLRAAHVHALARELATGKRFRQCLVRTPAITFHLLVCALGGGASSELGLRSIPCSGDRDGERWSHNLFRDARSAAEAFYKRKKKLCFEQRWDELAQLREKHFDFSHISAAASRVSNQLPPTASASLPPPIPVMEELHRHQRRSEVLWELLCGAFAPGSWLSPFRVFSHGRGELLHLIADFCVIENPEWVPKPQPRELHRLRKLTWLQQLELSAERATSDERRLEIEELQREFWMSSARKDAEIERLNAQLKAERQNAQSKLEEVIATCNKEVKELRVKLRTKDKEWKEDATEWQVM